MHGRAILRFNVDEKRLQVYNNVSYSFKVSIAIEPEEDGEASLTEFSWFIETDRDTLCKSRLIQDEGLDGREKKARSLTDVSSH